MGDWIARFVADYQPVKLAAMEAGHVPLTVGGSRATMASWAVWRSHTVCPCSSASAPARSSRG
ncbi:hypothetical protein [Streptomyces javensis]|uniref:hypothetical protein n=1 Tax=Streptomyces javensis TaxID=114698 RepID=UPI0031D4186A